MLKPIEWLLAVLLLPLAWLFPNHAPPWTAFQAEAWAAIVLLSVACRVLYLQCSFSHWHELPLFVFLLIVVVILQGITGLIQQFGCVWMPAIYLAGLALAFLTGANWERSKPHQVGDLIFASLLIACIVSMFFQFYQALNFTWAGIWILSTLGTRSSANLGQPNQLASLLLLGIVGSYWFYIRKKIKGSIAVGLILLLLLSLALTESRTAWITVSLIVFALAFWKNLLRSHLEFYAALSLALVFALFVVMLPEMRRAADDGLVVELRGLSDPARSWIWNTMLEAMALRPWAGYGWGQVGHTQFVLPLGEVFPGSNLQQAHNLFLDLLLWNGLPIGLLSVAFLVRWWWIALRKVSDVQQLVLLLAICVLSVHAMLEFPLQYGYFLFPFGLLVGALETSFGARVVLRTNKWVSILFSILVSVGAFLTIRDYLNVETSFYGLRFEQSKIATSIPSAPPNVRVLTQWRDYLKFVRMDVGHVYSNEEIAWAKDLTQMQPSALGMYRLAAMLAQAGRVDESEYWLKLLAKLSTPRAIEVSRIRWGELSALYPPIARVRWPVNKDF